MSTVRYITVVFGFREGYDELGDFTLMINESPNEMQAPPWALLTLIGVSIR